VAVLALFGCAGPASEDSRAVSSRFLDEIRSGQVEPAWQGTSSEFKSLMGLENMRDYVKRHPILKTPAEYAESRTIDRNGRTLNEHVFRATTQIRGKPVTATIKVLLAAGDDGWKVEHLVVE
jgi:hypothetical protein